MYCASAIVFIQDSGHSSREPRAASKLTIIGKRCHKRPVTRAVDPQFVPINEKYIAAVKHDGLAVQADAAGRCGSLERA